MKKIGFLKSEKENEKRVAIIYEDLKKIEKVKNLYFQKGYYKDFCIQDSDIERLGANVMEKGEVIDICDVIIDPKIGDSNDLNLIKNKIIFGWIHATQNKNITDIIVKNKLTAFAWEKMFNLNKHIFYRNNQIAGGAAVLHSSICFGTDYYNKNIAIIGNGNTALGTINMLSKLGANITVYNRSQEANFKKDMYNYDAIFNCLLWDVSRKDHIIYKKDLKKLKKGCVIVDISCDKNGAIESSIPTTISNPIYFIDGVGHYLVDHTPSLMYKAASESISKEIVSFVNLFINDEETESKIMLDSLIIDNGLIIDEEINNYQDR